jgi:hypothetical protein
MAISFGGFEHGLLLSTFSVKLGVALWSPLGFSYHLPISQSSIFKFVSKKNMWHTVSHLIVAKRARRYVPIKFDAAVLITSA